MTTQITRTAANHDGEHDGPPWETCTKCTAAARAEHIEHLIEDARAELGNAGFAAQIDMDGLAIEALTMAQIRIGQAIKAVQR